MIDWIQVRTDKRMKLISVPQQDIEDYLLISKLPNAKTMSVYDLPKNWMVGGMSYDFRTGSYMFLIMSPEFEPKPVGAEAETIVPTRHIIEITRKAVSK